MYILKNNLDLRSHAWDNTVMIDSTVMSASAWLMTFGSIDGRWLGNMADLGTGAFDFALIF